MTGQSRLRLMLLPECGWSGQFYSSAYIRLLRPFSHPGISNYFDTQVAHDYLGEPADVLILERGWKPNLELAQAEALIHSVRRANICLIYSLDDNLLAPHPNPETERNLEKMRPIIQLFARSAHGIIVTTDQLAKRISYLNQNIMVVPNMLDERLISQPAPQSSGTKKISIGYMGTFTHHPDLMEVLPALRQVFAAYGDILELKILGVSSDSSLGGILGEQGRVEVIHAPSADYPDFLSWMTGTLTWDIAIAPVAKNIFNECKSDIKLLDYGACGIPAVYSRVPIYVNSVAHGENGLLVENNTDAWVEALSYLIENPGERRRIGENARDYVINKRTLGQNAQNWLAMIRPFLYDAIRAKDS